MIFSNVKIMLAGLFAGSAISEPNYAPSKRVGPKRQGGAGVARAAQRKKASIKRNQAIPSGYTYSRQQRRAKDRRESKLNRISAAEFGRRKMQVIRQSFRVAA